MLGIVLSVHLTVMKMVKLCSSFSRFLSRRVTLGDVELDGDVLMVTSGMIKLVNGM